MHNKHLSREQVNALILPHVNFSDNNLVHTSNCKQCINLRSLTMAREMIIQTEELQNHVNNVQLETVKTKLVSLMSTAERHDALEKLIREGMVDKDPRISTDMRNRITKLIKEYHDVWHLQDSDHGDCGPNTTLNIDTGAHKPIFIPARRVKPHELNDVCAKLQEYIKTNILIPSNSPWQVPLVVVSKKTGGVRLCCDYRQLNDVTCKDCFQIPDTQAIIDAVGEHKPEWLSNTDMHAGYHQMRMSPESIKKTAIATPLGQFSFIMVPFGLTNAPSHYQRVMQEHLGNMRDLGLFIYLDDVLIVSETFELHFKTFEQMLERVRAAGMLLSPKKCALFKQSVKFVGYSLARAGISIDEDKVVDINNCPTPKTVTDVRAFLGKVGFVRRFLPRLASMIHPLLQLTHKASRFEWTEVHQQAMIEIKLACTKTHCLSYPQLEQPWLCKISTTQTAISLIWQQPDRKTGAWSTVLYCGKTFKGAEMNWIYIKRQFHALMWCMKHYQQYVSHAEIFIEFDQETYVKVMLNRSTTNRIIERWVALVTAFNPSIIMSNEVARNTKLAPLLETIDKPDKWTVISHALAAICTAPKELSIEAVLNSNEQKVEVNTLISTWNDQDQSFDDNFEYVSDCPFAEDHTVVLTNLVNLREWDQLNQEMEDENLLIEYMSERPLVSEDSIELMNDIEEKLLAFYEFAMIATSNPVDDKIISVTQTATTAEPTVTSCQPDENLQILASSPTSIAQDNPVLGTELLEPISPPVETNQIHTDVGYEVPQNITPSGKEPIWFDAHKLHQCMSRLQCSCKYVAAIREFKMYKIRDEQNSDEVVQWVVDNEEEFKFGQHADLENILFYAPAHSNKLRFFIPANMLVTLIHEVEPCMRNAHTLEQIAHWINQNFWWISTYKSKPSMQITVTPWYKLCTVEQIIHTRRNMATSNKLPWNPDKIPKKCK